MSSTVIKETIDRGNRVQKAAVAAAVGISRIGRQRGGIVLKLLRNTWYLACLAVVGGLAASSLWAQDDAEPADADQTPVEKKPYDVGPMAEKPLTLAEQKAAEDRKKALKVDYELNARLENTVWNDLDIRAGEPGQLWMLRSPKRVGQKVERAWHLNDSKGLPRVGSWSVKGGEVVLTAMNGTVIGRGKYNDDEIVGKFIDADHHREFGQFRLREETKRNYRVLSMHEQVPARRRK